MALRAARTTPAPITSDGTAIETEGKDLELELGRNWFALAGILALTVGVGFMLSLPLLTLPNGVPSLIGYAVAGGLLFLARAWRNSFEAAAGYLRAAAMILFTFSGLRLFFPAGQAVLEIGSMVGQLVLVASVALSLLFALGRKSLSLFVVGLLTSASTLLAVGTPGLVLAGICTLAAVSVWTGWKREWPVAIIAAIPLLSLTYLLWALGNPIDGRAVAFVTGPRFAPLILLLLAALFARGYFGRPTEDDAGESAVAKVSALLICALGYGLFLLHTFVAFRADLLVMHSTAAFVFLSLAMLSWIRDATRIGTFFYAMTGYAAMSVAILKGTTAPELFVWLSIQSVVVVATAIWFRSRLIVVANFGIFLVIVAGYVFTVGKETGISLGFGIVALLTARILRWQQHRLELRTELMRNAYMVTALVIFPYALAHLVPRQLVAVAWVGLALAYYGMNLIVQSPKYRWMGHATLLLTIVYVVLAAVRGLDPIYRVASFFALGVVLLVVSLSITRAKRKPLTIAHE